MTSLTYRAVRARHALAVAAFVWLAGTVAAQPYSAAEEPYMQELQKLENNSEAAVKKVTGGQPVSKVVGNAAQAGKNAVTKVTNSQVVKNGANTVRGAKNMAPAAKSLTKQLVTGKRTNSTASASSSPPASAAPHPATPASPARPMTPPAPAPAPHPAGPRPAGAPPA